MVMLYYCSSLRDCSHDRQSLDEDFSIELDKELQICIYLLAGFCCDFLVVCLVQSQILKLSVSRLHLFLIKQYFMELNIYADYITVREKEVENVSITASQKCLAHRPSLKEFTLLCKFNVNFWSSPSGSGIVSPQGLVIRNHCTIVSNELSAISVKQYICFRYKYYSAKLHIYLLYICQVCTLFSHTNVTVLIRPTV